jgi:hypothetical protein
VEFLSVIDVGSWAQESEVDSVYTEINQRSLYVRMNDSAKAE